MAKEWMIEALGENHLLLPGLIGAALTANDRVKYLLTLVQTARAAADGTSPLTSLREERLASGIDEPALDRVVSESAREADGSYRIPGVEGLSRRARDEVVTMLAPLAAAETPASSWLSERLEALSQELRRSARRGRHSRSPPTRSARASSPSSPRSRGSSASTWTPSAASRSTPRAA